MSQNAADSNGGYPDDTLDRGLGWWEPRLARLLIGALIMNSTTNEITADTGKAAAEPSKAKTGKRRMAREDSAAPITGTGNAPAKPHNTDEPARAISKIASVVALLERPEGATLGEMVEATGWLTHTTRAALSGLKKKGHTVTSIRADGVRTYRVVAADAAQGTSPAQSQVQVNA